MNLFSYLKTRLEILTIVSEYTTLKKTGFYWKGQCPFHAEKTASFTVSPHKEIFYCFGCHVGGDAIAFIARIENCTQLEAARFLIEKYQIELPQFLETEVSQIKKDTAAVKKYFTVCQAMANWCHQQLLKSAKAYSYVSKRGITKESVEHFKIGYLPGGLANIKRMCTQLASENILVDDLIDAHILSRSKKVLFSPFEERILFPITDHLGRYCGFGGRVFAPNDTRPKYYNSSENDYFAKGNLLFGLDLAKKEIQKTGTVFLVEGYTDCVLMTQSGYAQCVATLGTACTLEHLQAISRYAQRMYVLYDGDHAGHQAILRIGQLCWQVNLDLQVICLPKEEDPASFLTKNNRLDDYIASAQDIFSFYIQTLSTDFNKQSLSQKLELTRKIIQMIYKLDDELKQDILLHNASQKLGLSYAPLAKELSTLKAQKQSSQVKEIAAPVKAKPVLQAHNCLENKIFFAIMNNVQLFNKENEELFITYLPSPLCDILKKLQEAKHYNPAIGFLQFYELLENKQQQLVSKLLLENQEDIQPILFEQLVMQLQKKHWKVLVNNIKLRLEQARNHNNQQEIEEIMQEFLALKKKFIGKQISE